MSKYERLLYILNLLRTRKNLNAQILAKECEVTERTIYRDIISLSSANVPIYFDRGYKVLTGNFLPTLNFDLNEYLALREALRTTPLRELPDYRRTLKAIEAKVESGLSDTVKEQKKYSGADTPLATRRRIATNSDAKRFTTIEEAIRSKHVLEMTYDSIESGVRERNIEPCFSAYIEGKFYFVGFCLFRNDYRTFRLSRIIELRNSGKRFPRRHNLTPNEYFANSWSVFGGELADVEVEFSGRAARIIASGAHVKNEKKHSLPKGRLLYKVQVSGVEEIGRWVLGFGREARVLSPESLRAWVAEQARGSLSSNAAET
ncbi:MAG: YafY family transcriptional regulator [candidate division Zixibacteria bacterium]|nr:YafY family transcriptional regulator [candidate division Zixibacteria bacterium]